MAFDSHATARGPLPPGLGSFDRLTSNAVRAREQTRASAMYRGMGMTYWLGKLENSMNAAG